MSACCLPAHDSRTDREAAHAVVAERRIGKYQKRGMVEIPGGPFQMGSADADGFPEDGEGPVRTVEVASFYLDPTPVTNAQFATFAKATGYVTEAERIGWSFVFAPYVAASARASILDGSVPGAPWWAAVSGAAWRTPEGAGSTMATRQNHPAVHVSWWDAQEYAVWAGKRLPTEAEWEKAARGGLVGARHPWGDELTPGAKHRCNIWQGAFPVNNTGEDGFVSTAPVKAFPPNGFGLYQMTGNVWEWCVDKWSTDWHVPNRREARVDPQGPPAGDTHVIRGGSYLCHASYCTRYRVSARTHTTPDSSTAHMGFRCAADPVPPA